MKISRTCSCGAKISAEDEDKWEIDRITNKWEHEHRHCFERSQRVPVQKCRVCYRPYPTPEEIKEWSTEAGSFCVECGNRA